MVVAADEVEVGVILQDIPAGFHSSDTSVASAWEPLSGLRSRASASEK